MKMYLTVSNYKTDTIQVNLNIYFNIYYPTTLSMLSNAEQFITEILLYYTGIM